MTTSLPSLASEGIRFLARHEWSDSLKDWTRDYFFNEVVPVVSPLGLDPAHPLPEIGQ